MRSTAAATSLAGLVLALGLVVAPAQGLAATKHQASKHPVAHRTSHKPAARRTTSTRCLHRKNTGTVIGAVGGGILGNSLSHHGVGGALLGAGAGAVAGHEIARKGC